MLAAVLGGSVATAGCGREAAAPRVERPATIVPVGAVPADIAGIRAVVHASGVVVPAEGGELLVVAPEPARVVEVTRSVGDAVTSGEVLVRFDLPSATQDVARLSAELAGAEAQLENARINQTRMRELVDRGLVPRVDLNRADRDLADAQSAADRVRAARTAADAAAGRAVVRAPFDGIVAAREHDPGDLVLSTPADAVLRIVDPRRLEVIASVPAADVSRVVPGATARLAGPAAGVPVRLTVAGRIGGGIDSAGSSPFRLVFADATDLPVDARVEIDIDAEERTNTVLVPAEALVREDGTTVVMVAAGSTAERRVVTTGIEDEQRVEITSGIQPGELVITRGQIGLDDGAAISVATDREPSGPVH
jgi:cobalt-zinc-cadmium efflux system membrane fusion protein